MRARTFFAFSLGILLVGLPFVGCGGSSESTDPGTTCDPSACGGPPPARCADGSAATLTCVRNTDGRCGWRIGCPPDDASTDAKDGTPGETSTESGSDVPGDASDAADAPACPTDRPTRRAACPKLDQICFYPCGVVMRCTADGWDFDTTIDGGPPCP